MNPSKVGKTISFLRKQYGMTQHELADKIGVTDKAVSRWENGYGTPDISLLSKLAVVLDIDIESILEGNLTHWEMKWEGLLFLDYPEGISPLDYIYGTRIVEFQIGLLMLAGITNVLVCGTEKEIANVENILRDGKEKGFSIGYFTIEEMAENIKKKVIDKVNMDRNLMIIEAFSFVYGKDLTKTFRRIISDVRTAVQLLGFNKQRLGISFYKQRACENKASAQRCNFERGMISFQINNREDLLDATILLKIMEKHSGERIANIEDIAKRRGISLEEK